MLAADLVARRLFAPTELPVGVITGIVGAPYLLWLLARTNRTGGRLNDGMSRPPTLARRALRLAYDRLEVVAEPDA